jgi:hypothetical protein
MLIRAVALNAATSYLLSTVLGREPLWRVIIWVFSSMAIGPIAGTTHRQAAAGSSARRARFGTGSPRTGHPDRPAARDHVVGSQVRRGLAAGGSEIRTHGPPAIATIVFRLNFPARLLFRERPSVRIPLAQPHRTSATQRISQRCRGNRRSHDKARPAAVPGGV